MVEGDAALGALLRALKARNYRFITVTPATHARVIARPLTHSPDLRDIFGWSRQFRPDELDPELLKCLEAADALERDGEMVRSRVRVSSLDGRLFLHSAYPTDSADAVFFGPDTYRFARFLHDRIPRLPHPKWIVDMGAGSGAGGIVAAGLAPGVRVTLVDVNAAALRLARVNAEVAGVAVETLTSEDMPGGPDLIVANPPYIMDDGDRTYRDGGDLLGGAISRNWAAQALDALAPGGTLLLYTGAAYVEGRSPLIEALEETCASAQLTIEELDPDVFGEELDNPAYASVERIAAIGATIRKPR